jgi:queuosine precursor transporter
MKLTYDNNKPIILLMILSFFFIGNALVAEFIGGKIFSLEKTLGFSPFNFSIFGVEGLGFNLTAGVLLWPVVFIITDILNEYFGEKVVRFLSYSAVAVISYAFVMVYLAIGTKANDWWAFQSGMMGSNSANHIANMDVAFSKVMGQGLWIIVGSLVAFLIGQLVDVMVFQKIKRITGDGKIWLRATGSTLVSQFIDSFVVLFIAFYIGADWDIVRVIAIGVVNYIYKFIVAVSLTPGLYLLHNVIDNYLGKSLSEEMTATALNLNK